MPLQLTDLGQIIRVLIKCWVLEKNVLESINEGDKNIACLGSSYQRDIVRACHTFGTASGTSEYYFHPHG